MGRRRVKKARLFAVVEIAKHPSPLLANEGNPSTCHTERRR
jgi:hypothetical protein